MLNPTTGGNNPPLAQKAAKSSAALGSRSGDRGGATLSMGELHLRRLRYFLDLLTAGYRHALTPDPLVGSLRGERIALGIDVPELDTVPLWSVRRGDGMVSVPFIEFILGQICQILDALYSDPEPALTRPAEELAAGRRALGQILEQVNMAGGAAPSLPRMHDVFVAEALLVQVCGSGGLLEEIGRQAESLLITRVDSPGH